MATKTPTNYGTPGEDVHLDTLAQRVRARIGMILVLVLIGALAGIGVVARRKPLYQYKATVLMQPDEGVRAPTGLGGATPGDVLMGILASNQTIMKIAEAADVPADKMADTYFALAVNGVNQVEINCAMADKEQAKRAVSAALVIAKQRSRELNLSKSGRQAALLSESVTRLTGQLKVAEARLLAYQQQAKSAPDPNSPGAAGEFIRKYRQLQLELRQVQSELAISRQLSKATFANPEMPTGIPGLDEIRQRFLKIDYQVSVAEISAGPKAPEVVRLKKEREIARAQLQAEYERYFRSTETNRLSKIPELEARQFVLMSEVETAKDLADRAPKEALDAVRLGREVSTLNAVLISTRQQYETARVSAEAERINWSVLDEPFLASPDPVNKRFGPFAVFGAIGGLGLSLVLVLMLDFRKRKA